MPVRPMSRLSNPKPAHFAAVGAEDQLAKLISYIQKSYPELPVILDAKRGDIGSTAALYAKEAFERYGADAVTVNPYLGMTAWRRISSTQIRALSYYAAPAIPAVTGYRASGLAKNPCI